MSSILITQIPGHPICPWPGNRSLQKCLQPTSSTYQPRGSKLAPHKSPPTILSMSTALARQITPGSRFKWWIRIDDTLARSITEWREILGGFLLSYEFQTKFSICSEKRPRKGSDRVVDVLLPRSAVLTWRWKTSISQWSWSSFSSPIRFKTFNFSKRSVRKVHHLSSWRNSNPIYY